MSSFPILLGAIVIEDDTDGVYLDEAGVGIQCTLAHGTYYLTGDGTASDFLAALKTALEAGGANTYTITVDSGGNPTWSRSTSARAVTVTVSSNAVATFRVRWAHANTTFGAAQIGFTTEKGAADNNAESGTVSPTTTWVSDNVHEDTRELPSWVVTEQELENGDVDIVRHSEKMNDRSLVMPMLSDANLFIADESITNRSLEAFMTTCGDGRPVQLHVQALQSGSTTLIDDLSSTTLVGTYRLGSDAQRALAASERSQLGMAYSDVSLILRSYSA